MHSSKAQTNVLNMADSSCAVMLIHSGAASTLSVDVSNNHVSEQQHVTERLGLFFTRQGRGNLL